MVKMVKDIRIAISGGGTGGHIYPAIAICRELLQLEPGVRMIYIGGKGKREADIVPRYGLDFTPIYVESFPRRLSARWLKVALRVPMGFIESLLVLKRFSPQLVIGTGGYVCGPVLLGALILHIPMMIQEQNAMPGVTNRIMGRWADEIHVPFKAAVKFFPSGRTRITANPIRPEIATMAEGKGNKDKLTILVVGGSQGASSINKAVLDALKYLDKFAPGIQMIHQTGKADFLTVKEAYDKSPFAAIVQPYFDAMEEVYAVADLVICRAGAMTIAEITACGLPAVLIPYPFAAADHQTFNARALEERGAGVMIRDDQLTGDRLANVLLSLIQDRGKLNDMAEKSRSLGRPGAAREIAQAALSLVSSVSAM